MTSYPRMDPVMNAQQLFQLSASFILAVNIYVHLWTKDKNPSTNEFQNITEVVVILSKPNFETFFICITI